MKLMKFIANPLFIFTLVVFVSVVSLNYAKAESTCGLNPEEDEDIEPPVGDGTKQKLASGNLTAAERILGGVEVRPGQFPPFVFIIVRLDYRRSISCSGVLIHERLVLTAAHCIQRVFNDEVNVFVGLTEFNTTYNDDNADIYRMDKVCVSKKFKVWNKDRRNIHDFGIIRLREAVNLGYSVDVACLPGKKALSLDNPKPNQVLWFVGIGQTGDNNPLKPIKYLLVKHVPCLPHYQPHESRICFEPTEDITGNSCKGDSGGPTLMVRRDGRHCVYGVHSSGYTGLCQKRSVRKTISLDVHNVFADIKETMKTCLRD